MPATRRRRGDRVRPLDEPAVGEDADRHVLAGLERRRVAVEADPDVGEAVGLVLPPDEAGVVDGRGRVDDALVHLGLGSRLGRLLVVRRLTATASVAGRRSLEPRDGGPRRWRRRPRLTRAATGPQPSEAPGAYNRSRISSERTLAAGAGGPTTTRKETPPHDRHRHQPDRARAPRRQALHLRLGRRPGRGRRDDARPARRQGRRAGRDDHRRPARSRPASRSRPRRATTTSPPASSCRTGSGTTSSRRSRRSRQETGKGFGDAANPLLVSVRSGAKFSMPGMMDTVLNLGLNEQTLHGPHRADRQRALRLGRLPAVHPDVRADRHGRRRRALRPRPRRGQGSPRRDAGHGPRRGGAARGRRRVQGDRPRGHRPRLPGRPVRAARPRDQGRLRQLVRQARPRLPREPEDRPRPRHRGQRRDDGLRQHGRRLGHRRGLHPRPEHRREGALRRVPHQRPGRGRRRRHPHAPARSASSPRTCRRPTPSSSGSPSGSSATTATSRTSSSRSSAAGCSCSRRGAPSGPRRPP